MAAQISIFFAKHYVMDKANQKPHSPPDNGEEGIANQELKLSTTHLVPSCLG